MRELPFKSTISKSPERIVKSFNFTAEQNTNGIEINLDVGNSKEIGVYIDLYGNFSEVLVYSSIDGNNYFPIDDFIVLENDFIVIKTPYRYVKIRVSAPNIPVSFYISYVKY